MQARYKSPSARCAATHTNDDIDTRLLSTRRQCGIDIQ
jgi:hypothetical protein